MKITRFPVCILIVLVLLAVTFGSALSVAEGTANNLFSDALPSSHPDSAQEQSGQKNPTIMRSRYVQVNFDYLFGSNLFDGTGLIVLNLFDNVSFNAVKDRLDVRQKNRYTWVGTIEGIKHSQVILTVEDGIMAGNITLPQSVYQIRAVSKGTHAVYEIDQSAFPEEAPPVRVETLPESSNIHPQPESMTDDGSVIDIMVAYTTATASASANIAAEIQLGIDETNQSYINSGINQRLRLVHTAQVAYTENGDMLIDLNRLRSKTDGIIDNVHSLRDAYGADLVSLWVESGNYCGIAYFMSTVSHSFESSGFSVVRRNCATGLFSFGHEFGHNMSATHDWHVENGTSPYTYIHGYVYRPNRWRTVMAYNNECADNGVNCTRLQYWSNPNVSYSGIPMGVPAGQYHPADNRRTLNNTAYTVANFRQSVAAAVVADIKANGSDGVVTITPADTLVVTVALDDGNRNGNADWWVLAGSPFGWYYYNLYTNWQPGMNVTYQGPLVDLTPYTVLNMPLPAGPYTFYFGVDMSMNGSIDGQIYYDSVNVNIKPQGGCQPQSCGNYTLDCNPGHPCACVAVAEGGGQCVSNQACFGLSSCSSSSQCAAGEFCAVNTCCNGGVGGVCYPAVCSIQQNDVAGDDGSTLSNGGGDSLSK